MRGPTHTSQAVLEVAFPEIRHLRESRQLARVVQAVLSTNNHAQTHNHSLDSPETTRPKLTIEPRNKFGILLRMGRAVHL